MRIIKTITRNLLFYEALVLAALVYFFWYPSAFPAKTADTGITSAEWVWLVAALLPVGVAYLVAFGQIQIRAVKSPALLVIPLVYVLLMWHLFSSDGALSAQVDRADYIPFLVLLLPVLGVRLVVYGRVGTRTTLDGFFVALIVLCLLNIRYAPYPVRGWQMLARPLLGMALVIHCVELARASRTLTGILWILTVLGGIVGVVGLTATQWTTKSADFRGVLDLLPEVDYWFAAGGFNPNEIAGAIAWLCPLMAGVALYVPGGRTLRTTAGVAFVLLLAALLLGQSRAALIGVGAGLLGVLVLIVPGGWRRSLALGGLAALVVLQLSVTFHFFPQDGVPGGLSGDGGVPGGTVTLSPRDERTANQRVVIWENALTIVREHPFTGVGMNNFRSGGVRQDYPLSQYPALFLPHAHNEFIQIATDLGLPGLLVFAGLHLVVAWLLWRAWRRGSRDDRVIVVSVAMGLFAHGVYGMGDAIPLWDRFSFVFWLMLGVVASNTTVGED